MPAPTMTTSPVTNDSVMKTLTLVIVGEYPGSESYPHSSERYTPGEYRHHHHGRQGHTPDQGDAHVGQ